LDAAPLVPKVELWGTSHLPPCTILFVELSVSDDRGEAAELVPDVPDVLGFNWFSVIRLVRFPAPNVEVYDID
jgi:hypothetical protein